MKNLKKLETDGLLKSKSYGLSKEIFWQIYASKTENSPKKNQEKLLEELGYKSTNWEIHSSLYDHEKACADIFISLALTDTLMEWGGEGNQKSGLRHDRKFRIDDRIFYLEVERDSQGADKLRDKLARYVKHYREKEEPFHVLFTVNNETELERLIYLFEEKRLNNSYAAVIHQDFISSPLSGLITTRFDTFRLSD